MTRRDRLYQVGLSSMCYVLCLHMALPYRHFQWQWWVWVLLSAYAMQPLVAETKLILSYIPRPKGGAIDMRPYSLEGHE